MLNTGLGNSVVSAAALATSAGGVVPPVPVNSVAPVVSGTAQQGQTLSVTNGTWTNSPTGYSYVWKRAGVTISGATATTYVLVVGDVGALISCAVTATNAGGSATASSNNVGPVLASIPFMYDANFSWYDPSSNRNTADNIGTPTFSALKEQLYGVSDIIQPIKSRQPIVRPNGAVAMNRSTDRHFVFDKAPTITNGKSGWYFSAVLIVPTVESHIMTISRNASTTVASRGDIYFTSTRAFAVKYATADGGTTAFAGFTAQQTAGAKIAIEAKLDLVTPTLTVWIGGVQVVLANGPTVTAAAFPSSNPLSVIFGNVSSLNFSYDEDIFDIKFYDGLIPDDIRTSASAHSVAKAAT